MCSTARAPRVSVRARVILVDTNVLSELPRPRPNAKVVSWFAGQETVHVSVITLEELAFGVARAAPRARSRLGRWLDALLEAVTSDPSTNEREALLAKAREYVLASRP